MTYAILDEALVPRAEARLDIEDRAVQFSESAYEVILCVAGRLIDATPHMARLQRSLNAIGIAYASDRMARLQTSIDTLIRQMPLDDGMVYIQVSGGTAERTLVPHSKPAPISIAYGRALTLPRSIDALKTIRVCLMPDPRWTRCDIKSTALLGNAMARGAAMRDGYDDAILHDNLNVTEASAANAWMVKGQRLFTHPSGPKILSGITRERLLALAQTLGIETVETPFTPAALLDADEAFISSATALVTAITSVGKHTLGAGRPGPVTRALFSAYLDYILP